MRLREAVPVRHERSDAFVKRARGCSIEQVRSPVYAVSPAARELRERRVRESISLCDAASRAGIRAIEWSGVEHGKLVPEAAADWDVLRRAVTT
jgi:hypothetical protein